MMTGYAALLRQIADQIEGHRPAPWCPSSAARKRYCPAAAMSHDAFATPPGWPTRAGCAIGPITGHLRADTPAAPFPAGQSIGGQIIDFAAERARRSAGLAPADKEA